MNLQKVIYEGWTVQHFIDELDWTINLIMRGRSITKTFVSKKELKVWCKDNQPYYKKHIPEVVEHFAKQYNLT